MKINKKFTELAYWSDFVTSENLSISLINVANFNDKILNIKTIFGNEKLYIIESKQFDNYKLILCQAGSNDKFKYYVMYNQETGIFSKKYSAGSDDAITEKIFSELKHSISSKTEQIHNHSLLGGSFIRETDEPLGALSYRLVCSFNMDKNTANKKIKPYEDFSKKFITTLFKCVEIQKTHLK